MSGAEDAALNPCCKARLDFLRGSSLRICFKIFMLPESNDFLNGVISFAICGLQFDREYLVWLSVKQAASQPLVGKQVKIASAKILWLPGWLAA